MEKQNKNSKSSAGMLMESEAYSTKTKSKISLSSKILTSFASMKQKLIKKCMKKNPSKLEDILAIGTSASVQQGIQELLSSLNGLQFE